MSSNFKELFSRDLRHTFLNLDEYGEKHRVEGKEITIVVDEEASKELTKGQGLGIAASSLLFSAAVEDLPPRKPAGNSLNVDGREYIILDWSEDMGLAAVALEQNTMR